MTDPGPQWIVPDPLPVELYEVEFDRVEFEDLAIQEPERTSRMLSELEAWCEEVEAERLKTKAGSFSAEAAADRESTEDRE